MLTMEQGIKEIMAIIGEDNDNVKNAEVAGAGGAHETSAVKTVKTVSKANSETKTSTIPTVVDPSQVRCGKMNSETVYDGRGHVVSVNGKSTTTGYVKGAKRVSRPSDILRKDMLDAAEVIINRSVAFNGKVGRNSVEGVVVRMADADYTVKSTLHAKSEFSDREANFVATKNFLTRGKAENHSPAIAKILISEIENEFSKTLNENENRKPVTLLSATASVIRFEIGNQEFSYKITKKRTRVVMS